MVHCVDAIIRDYFNNDTFTVETSRHAVLCYGVECNVVRLVLNRVNIAVTCNIVCSSVNL